MLLVLTDFHGLLGCSLWWLVHIPDAFIWQVGSDGNYMAASTIYENLWLPVILENFFPSILSLPDY